MHLRDAMMVAFSTWTLQRCPYMDRLPCTMLHTRPEEVHLCELFRCLKTPLNEFVPEEQVENSAPLETSMSSCTVLAAL